MSLPLPGGSASAACYMLSNALNAKVALLNKLLGYPKKLLRNMEFIARQIQASADSEIANACALINDAADALPDLTPNSSEFLNAINNCPYFSQLLGEDTISDINKGVAAFGDAVQLPKKFMNEMTSTISGGLTGALDDMLEKNLYAKLAKLEEMYNEFLEKSGINKMLEEINTIQTCLQNVCGSIGAVENYYDKLKEELKIGEDGKCHLIESMKSEVGEDIKNRAASARDMIADTKSRIASVVDFGL